MKYQSEIIHEILEQRGHDKSSLHYQSECIEKWLEETKGAYPKLTDYQAEWLNYIVENPIGKFPYETITTNSTATVNNVVPFAYQSAILKGQTLVNLCELSGMNKPQSNREDVVDIPLHHLKENTQYTVIVNLLESSDTSIAVGFLSSTGNSWKGVVRNVSISSDMKILITTGTDLGNKLRIHNNSSTGTLTIKNAIVLEGDYTNQDISYFEGMQSVKMPVLTTTGKNLFDEVLENNKDIDVNTGAVLTGGRTIPKNFIPVEPNTYYTLTRPVAKFNVAIRYYSKSQGYLSSQAFMNHNEKFTATFITPSDCYFVKFIDESNTLRKGYQIEQGTQSTSYQPYKSYILTVNEDIELRGIGDVKDEMNCLTGELTQRVSEIVVDGSQSEISVDKSLDNTVLLIFTSLKTGLSSDTACICDKLPFKANSSEDLEHMRLNVNGYVCFWINKTKFEDLNGASIRKYLQQNPITVQYPLATESVKTVDLTITDESGNKINRFKPIEGTMHIQTDGTPIKPTVSMEIPVEAITQNLASFIEEV